MVELAIQADNLAADRFEHLRRERPGGAVAAGADHLEAALDLGTVGEVGDIAGAEVLDKRIRAAATHVEAGFEHDLLEAGHLIRAEGERAIGTHLHAGPAIVVVRRGDHGHAGHIEVELGEVRHGRDREADVVDLAARRQKTGYQGGFDRRRIGSKIVAGHDLWLHAEFVDERAEAEPQCLHPHEVEFSAQKPSRVVFAKTGGLHQRLGFVRVGIGGERGLGLGEHHASYRRGDARQPHSVCGPKREGNGLLRVPHASGATDGQWAAIGEFDLATRNSIPSSNSGPARPPAAALSSVPLCGARFGPAGRCRCERVVRPGMARIATFHFGFDRPIAAAPEARQVARHLHRPLCRRQ